MEQYTLKNGVRVMLDRQPQAESCTAVIGVHVGSGNEHKNINGVSHFIEHLLFKGSKKRPTARAINVAIDEVGGENNAFTSKEITAYYIKATSQALPVMIDILSDMVRHPLFRAADIERERGVILEEINMYEDRPDMVAVQVFEDLVFAGTTMGRPIIGTKGIISKVSRQAITDYFLAHYTPARVVLSIAGSFSKAQAKKIVAKSMRSWEQPRTERQALTFTSQNEPRLKVMTRKTAQTHFACGVRTFGLNHKERFAAEVLAVILGGNMSSRLFSEIREKRGLAYYVRTEADEYSHDGYLCTRSGVKHGSFFKALQLTLHAYKNVKRSGVTAAEISRAKKFLQGRFSLSIETSDERAFWNTANSLLDVRADNERKVKTGIQAVTAADIMYFAKTYFNTDRLSLSVVGPVTKTPALRKMLRL